MSLGEVDDTTGKTRLSDEVLALKSISQEELQEQADEVGYLTPREFAKLQGVRPQQVYTWIRKGLFSSERCKCGRTIVNVAEAQAALLRRKRELGKFVAEEDDPKFVPASNGTSDKETEDN